MPVEQGEQVLPAGEVAFTRASGEQVQFPEILGAYDAVVDWARANGRELGGSPREIYLSTSGEPLLIEVAWPLR